jgi:hypothetical protein
MTSKGAVGVNTALDMEEFHQAVHTRVLCIRQGLLVPHLSRVQAHRVSNVKLLFTLCVPHLFSSAIYKTPTPSLFSPMSMIKENVHHLLHLSHLVCKFVPFTG